MQELLRSSPHLLELDLSHNGMRDSHVFMLVEAMWSPKCHLQVLNLTRNHLSAACVRMLLPHCCGGVLSGSRESTADKRLRRGGVSGKNGAGSEGVACGIAGVALARSPSCRALQLIHVNLSDNPVGDIGMRLMCDVVCKATTKCLLHTLQVSCFSALSLRLFGFTVRYETGWTHRLIADGQLPPHRALWNSSRGHATEHDHPVPPLPLLEPPCRCGCCPLGAGLRGQLLRHNSTTSMDWYHRPWMLSHC